MSPKTIIETVTVPHRMSGKSERAYSWLDSAHVKPQEKNELVEMDDSRDGEHLIT